MARLSWRESDRRRRQNFIWLTLCVYSGNSWLAICQLHFASRFQHPALKAIAPWEGAADIYGDMYLRGGIPHLLDFTEAIGQSFAGELIEAVGAQGK